MTNFFQAVGAVLVLCIALLVVVGMIYISYVLAIGVLIVGAIVVAYQFLKALKAPGLDI